MTTAISSLKKSETANRFAFARHETFHVRDGWLLKGLDAVVKDPNAFYHKDGHHRLGVGKNILRSISYWVQATGLVEPDANTKGLRPPLIETPLASLIRKYDPYLEDDATLWALHIQLASNRSKATFWYFAFNEFSQREFTEERIVKAVRAFLDDHGVDSIAESSLHKDARCWIRTYLPSRTQNSKSAFDDSLDSPLTSLNLLKQSPLSGHYQFQVGPPGNISPLVFAYSLYHFRQLSEGDAGIASLEDLRWAPYSPGRLLGLDMRSILDYLERLEAQTSYVRLIRTAGLSVVSLQDDIDPLSILAHYYSGIVQ